MLASAAPAADHSAQPGPTVLDPNLDVRTVVAGLSGPTLMAFLGSDDFLVLEKPTGRVKRIVGGAVQGTVLDLAVNSASERGLLGIALDPGVPGNPSEYLFWTESNTGTDSNVLSQTPLLGNRVDRFVWNGSSITRAENVVRLRAIQQDPTNATPQNPLEERGIHDSGMIRFGHDGKLYVFACDTGRRGWMQNLRCGPTNRYDCPPRLPLRTTSSTAAARQRAPHRRRPAAQPRRHHPGRPPILRRRSGDGRRGRRQRPKGLLLRPPQHLRHGASRLFLPSAYFLNLTHSHAGDHPKKIA